MNKITNFAKQVFAQLTGDTDGVIAAQNERKANSSLKSQIAVLEGKVVDQEEKVSDLKDALIKAKYPPTKIMDGETYLQGIRYAQERVDAAQEQLATTNDSIKYWKTLLEEYAEQVDQEESKQAA